MSRKQKGAIEFVLAINHHVKEVAEFVSVLTRTLIQIYRQFQKSQIQITTAELQTRQGIDTQRPSTKTQT